MAIDLLEIFGKINIVERFLRRYEFLEYMVIGSGLASSPDKYVRTASLVIYTVLALSSVIIGFVLSVRIGVILSIGIAVYVAFLVILPLSLAIALAIPSLMYRHRGASIESKFMILALYLSSMLAGGATLSNAFHELATTYIDSLKPFALELKLINSKLSIGEPVDRVLDYVARLTPSSSLRELFQALAAASRVGVAIVDVVNTVISGYLDRFGVFLEKETDSLAILFDSYTTIAMTVPIIVGTAALLFTFIGGLQQYLQIIAFVSFILLTIISIVTLIIADAIASRLRL
ncbi:hypothetical protein DRO31_06080 [Candidatus Bathyarchaeota archaeon]|nr:MAG: hypothetical protein DRO31_06080 [Candidatus Bathyarchaeota archaeon]